jgi:hypothetical protein
MELESVKSSWAITILRLCLTTIIAGSILWSTFEDSYPNCSGIWLSSFFPFRHSQKHFSHSDIPKNDNSIQFHGIPNFLANQHQSLRFPLDSRSLFEFQGSRMLHWFMKFMKASKSYECNTALLSQRRNDAILKNSLNSLHVLHVAVLPPTHIDMPGICVNAWSQVVVSDLCRPYSLVSTHSPSSSIHIAYYSTL